MESTIVEIKPKRGRRTKKEIELANAALTEEKVYNPNPTHIPILTPHNPIKVEKTENNEKVEKIKKEKKEKKVKITKHLIIVQPQHIEFNNLSLNPSMEIDEVNDTEPNKPMAKKRGRKPKGGKIIQNIPVVNTYTEPKPNVILHLKCSTKDLENSSEYNSTFINNNTKIESFDFCSKNELYEIITQEHQQPQQQQPIQSYMQNPTTSIIEQIDYTYKPEQQQYQYCTTINKDNLTGNINNNDNANNINSVDETKNIWRKLKILEHDLNINNIKKSACFWCSHDFDNPPIYIPKFFFKESYHVYGCFCSPECATAHLMEENIDSSIKFERYYLINHIYSKIYDYKKNIKPAPNPYYMLEKYYGNLTIQEYRALLKSERLFLIVDKPLTRILPEFHEDNDEFIINNKIIPSNNFQVKKRLQKKIQPKNNNNILHI